MVIIRKCHVFIFSEENDTPPAKNKFIFNYLVDGLYYLFRLSLSVRCTFTLFLYLVIIINFCYLFTFIGLVSRHIVDIPDW